VVHGGVDCECVRIQPAIRLVRQREAAVGRWGPRAEREIDAGREAERRGCGRSRGEGALGRVGGE